MNGSKPRQQAKGHPAIPMRGCNSGHIETVVYVTSFRDHEMIRKPGARHSETQATGIDLAAVMQVEAS
jgi:hypothetical protein